MDVLNITYRINNNCITDVLYVFHDIFTILFFVSTTFRCLGLLEMAG